MSFKIQPWLVQDRRHFTQGSLLRRGTSAPQGARLLPRAMQVLGLCNVNGSMQFQRGGTPSTVYGKVTNCAANNNSFIAPQHEPLLQGQAALLHLGKGVVFEEHSAPK